MTFKIFFTSYILSLVFHFFIYYCVYFTFYLKWYWKIGCFVCKEKFKNIFFIHYVYHRIEMVNKIYGVVDNSADLKVNISNSNRSRGFIKFNLPYLWITFESEICHCKAWNDLVTFLQDFMYHWKKYYVTYISAWLSVWCLSICLFICPHLSSGGRGIML